MLTKSLVRYRIRKGKVYPNFLDPDDPDLLASATSLIDLFEQGLGQTRDDLAEAASELIEVSPFEAIIARGFEKLLLDRCDFESPEDESRPQLRGEVFSFTSSLLSQNSYDGMSDYLDQIGAHFQQPATDLAGQIYSDLPGQNPLLNFRSLSPAQLLHRYNCSLIQWLLLHSASLKVTITGTRTGALRQIFKYLRFHQLLAKISSEESNVFQLDIDGALSIFYQTKKYGMKLAMFFPALLHQEQWQLQVDLAVDNQRKGTLTLDQSCGIQPEGKRFHGFIPPEIRDFGASLETRIPAWKARAYPGFLILDGEYCFPDFTLTHTSGRKISIELFHQWHKSHFVNRLQKLEELNSENLILGLDQKLKKDPLVADLLAGSRFFKDFGFSFRDLPTVNVVQPILDRITAEH